jgi:hypothetical protein
MNAPHQTQLFVLGCVYQGIGGIGDAKQENTPLVKHP